MNFDDTAPPADPAAASELNELLSNRHPMSAAFYKSDPVALAYRDQLADRAWAGKTTTIGNNLSPEVVDAMDKSLKDRPAPQAESDATNAKAEAILQAEWGADYQADLIDVAAETQEIFGTHDRLMEYLHGRGLDKNPEWQAEMAKLLLKR